MKIPPSFVNLREARTEERHRARRAVRQRRHVQGIGAPTFSQMRIAC